MRKENSKSGLGNVAFGLRVSAFCLLAMGALAVSGDALAWDWSDEFEGRQINEEFWALGGYRFGAEGIGSGGYEWSHEVLTNKDGRLAVNITGPESNARFGATAWVQTKYNYNDGDDHAVNFTWGSEVSDDYVNHYGIQIGNDHEIDYDSFSWIASGDQTAGRTLYYTHEHDISPTSWSIEIDSAENTARLHNAPDLAGDVIATKVLDPEESWYVRFVHTDVTQVDRPTTDNTLFLYSYSSSNEPGDGGGNEEDEWPIDTSFRLEWDMKLNSAQDVSKLEIGLFDPERIQGNKSTVVDFSISDGDHEMGITAYYGNILEPGSKQMDWIPSTWHRCIIEFDAVTGSYYLTMTEGAGGPAEEGTVTYTEDFESDPVWFTDSPLNNYWDQEAGTYHVVMFTEQDSNGTTTGYATGPYPYNLLYLGVNNMHTKGGLDFEVDNISLNFDVKTEQQVAPVAETIAPITSGPTNSDTVSFSVNFSKSVVNFDDVSDLVVTGSGITHSGAVIYGGPDTYWVDITGVDGNGTLSLAVNTGSDVQDIGGLALSSSVTSDPVVIDNRQPMITSMDIIDGRTLEIIFDEEMGLSASIAANYQLSGSGQGSLTANPYSTTHEGDNKYQLLWLSGEMFINGDITITVPDVTDVAGNVVGAPNTVTYRNGGIGVRPTVGTVEVPEELTVTVVFSEALGDGGVIPGNYTVSGSGTGTLADHPDSATTEGNGIYTLVWDSGDMFHGGDITITVGNVTDVAGNAIDSPNSGTAYGEAIGSLPKATLSSSTGARTNISPIPVSVKFNEPVTDFTASDIEVTNGVLSGLSGSGANYTFNLTPASQGTVTVNIWADVVVDEAGNSNVASNTFSRYYETVPPTVSEVIVQTYLTINVVFSEPLGESALSVANYTVSGIGRGTLAANPSAVVELAAGTYQLTWDEGDMLHGGDITITASNVYDLAGNKIGNPDSGTHAGGAIGTIPQVTVLDVDSLSTIDVTFSEPMALSALTAVNYVLSSNGKGTFTERPDSVVDLGENTYRLTWNEGEMLDSGNITITVTDVHDLAGNPISYVNSVTYYGGGMGIRPWLDSISVLSSQKVLVTFSEPVDVGFADVANYTATGTRIGTLASHPDSVNVVSDMVCELIWSTGQTAEDGVLAITVENVKDLAGNIIGFPNMRTDPPDYTAPTVTVEQQVDQPDPTNVLPIMFDIVFDEPVTGLDESGVTIYGTATGVEYEVTSAGEYGLYDTAYTLTITNIIGDGTVIPTVNAGSALDPAENATETSTSDDNEVTYDSTAPSPPMLIRTVPSSPSSDSTPVVLGTAEAGSLVQLYDTDGETLIGFGNSGADGKFLLSVFDLEEGEHIFFATATDAVGNVSGLSPGLAFELDFDALSSLFINLLISPDPANLETELLITFDATEPLAGAPVVTVGGNLAENITDEGSVFSFAFTYLVSETDIESANVVLVTGADIAGNEGAIEGSVVFDFGAPEPPELIRTIPGSPSNDQTPIVIGKAEPLSLVTLYDGSEDAIIGFGVADELGAFLVTVSMPLEEGAHTLLGSATDVALNQSDLSEGLEYVVDVSYLFYDLSITPDPANQSSKLTITFDALDELPVGVDPTVTVDGRSASVVGAELIEGLLHYTYSYQVSDADTEGPKLVLVEGTDLVGNDGHADGTVVFDFVAPTAPVLIRTVPSSPSYNPTPLVEGLAECMSIVTIYDTDENTIVGSAQANQCGIFSFYVDELLSGGHSLFAKASDAAGNISDPSNELDYGVITARYINLTVTPDPANQASLLTITFEATEVLPEDPAVLVGGFAATPYDSSPTDSGMSYTFTYQVSGKDVEGANVVYVEGFDEAGYPITALESVLFDFTAPEAPVLNSITPVGPSRDQTPLIDGSAEENCDITLYDSEDEAGSAKSGFVGSFIVETTMLTSGTHSFSAIAVDAAGNVSEESNTIDYVVDMTAPLFDNLLVAPDPAGPLSVLTITFDALYELEGDPVVTVSDRATVPASQSGLSYTFTYQVSEEDVEGANVVKVTGVDTEGNPDTLEQSVLFDFTAPEAPILLEATNSVTGSSTTVTGTAEELSTIILYNGDGEVVGNGQTDATGNFTITTIELGEGTHVITATATDAVGNVSHESNSLEVVLTEACVFTASIVDTQFAGAVGVAHSIRNTSIVKTTLGSKLAQTYYHLLGR
ncbi:Ig-like domain-containing protein [Candidatus Hydrogenedentota bacterium]